MEDSNKLSQSTYMIILAILMTFKMIYARSQERQNKIDSASFKGQIDGTAARIKQQLTGLVSIVG